MHGSEHLIVNWVEFSTAICKRFNNKDDIMKEFNKLVQERIVEDYVEKFEELKSLRMH